MAAIVLIFTFVTFSTKTAINYSYKVYKVPDQPEDLLKKSDNPFAIC